MQVPVCQKSCNCRLGLIGDLGQTADSAETLDHLDAQDVVSVLDVGDLSYADSYQPRWDSYGRLLEYHTSRVPWMHIEGNVSSLSNPVSLRTARCEVCVNARALDP